MSRSTRSLSSLRYWQWLLSAERALTSIISYLLPPEAVCLLVYALEAEYEPLVRFLYAHSHLLSFGDASRRFTNILHCAAAHGLAQVVQRFLRFQLNYRLCLNVKTTGTNDVLTMKHTLLNGKIFAWCLRNSTYTFPAEVMYEASRQGNQEVIQWLDHCCQYTTYKAMEYAASSGHLDIVMWFYEKTLKQNTEQLVYMVQSLEDKLQVLNWVTVFPTERYFREGFASRDGLLAAIYDQRDPLLPWTNGTALDLLFTRKRYRALDTAAAKGDFTMVTKLHQDGRWPCTSLAMDMAAANGHLEIVKFLHHNRREGGTAVGMCSAAGNGLLQVVQWLYQNRSSDGCRPMVLDLAATNGHVDVLRWLAPRFTQFSCSPAFLPSVAAQGNIKTLQYLHKEMRMPLDQRTLEAAIGSGHFELVTYIFDRVPTEVKHTLSITAAEKAAASGNLELLAFVVERLGVWSPQVLIAAALTGNVEMAKWIVKRMDSPSAEPEEVVLVRERRYRAATSITMDTIVLDPSSALLKRRVSYNNITSAEFVRPLDIVDGSTLYRCASLRHFDMIEWILRHRLFSPSFSLSMKEGEIVLRAVVGRGMTDDDALDADKACNGDTNAATTESATVAAIATVTATKWEWVEMVVFTALPVPDQLAMASGLNLSLLLGHVLLKPTHTGKLSSCTSLYSIILNHR